MAYQLPSLATIQANILADIQNAAFPVGGLLPDFSVLQTLSEVIAMQSFEQYQYIGYCFSQSTPFTATGIYIDAWMSLIGIIREGSTSATGFVQFTGTPNTTISQNTQITRFDNIQYITTQSNTIAANGICICPVIASVPGSTTNLTTIGTAFTLNTPIAGANSFCTSTSVFTGGADSESDISLKSRGLQAFAARGKIGSVEDYINIVKTLNGITRVFVNPLGAGAGTIVVYPFFDVVNANNNGLPLGSDGVATSELRIQQKASGDQLNVANQLFPLQQATAIIWVASAIPVPINISIRSLSVNTAAIQSAIYTALQTLFVDLGSPVGTSIAQNQLIAAIQTAIPQTATFTLLTPTDITLTTGYIPIVGSIQYS